jgi:5'(3')-deoxyribonucleotidase
MATQRIAIDIDNVIAQSDEVMRQVISEVTSGRVNLAYEDIVEFRYERCFDAKRQQITDNEWRRAHDQFSIPSNLLSVAPVASAYEALLRIAEHFTIHLVTARLKAGRIPTIEWLDKHFPGLPYGLHFVTHGEKHLVMGELAVSVEDDYDQAVAFADRGVLSFVLDQPWNRRSLEAEGIIRCHDWPELASMILAGADAEKAVGR